ncbi:MAG: tetratricopeptide repeat protein, partial [Arenimonas sp.]
MILFYFIASLLVLIALGLALHPLFKTHRTLAILVFIGLPLVTFSLYQFVGKPQALDAAFIAKNRGEPGIEDAVSSLEAELKSHPENLEGWVLLARTSMALGNYEAANLAFAKAIVLEPGNPDLKTERAEAMMRASDKRAFPAEAVELLKQALSENPEHQRALFFIGLHYLQQGDSGQAELYLNKLIPMLDTEAANALREQINIARAQQNKPLLQMAAEPASEAINVVVSLDKDMTSALKPGAVLFVFAKPVNASGPPVAAKRIEISSFPFELQL